MWTSKSHFEHLWRRRDTLLNTFNACKNTTKIDFCLQCSLNLREVCNSLKSQGTWHPALLWARSQLCGSAVGPDSCPATTCCLLFVVPFYCLGERWDACFMVTFWHGHANFLWCVSCCAADRPQFCSFSGERIYIILALIVFLPKQRPVRVVICLLHICSIVRTICPAVFLYVFIFNFQILSNADISSLAQISQCLGVRGVSHGQQKPSISFLMTERKHS